MRSQRFARRLGAALITIAFVSTAVSAGDREPVLDQVGRGVVRVEVRHGPGLGWQLDQTWSALEDLLGTMASERTTGVVLDGSGVVVTRISPAHVWLPRKVADVALPDGRVLRATLRGHDPETGLAVLFLDQAVHGLDAVEVTDTRPVTDTPCFLVGAGGSRIAATARAEGHRLHFTALTAACRAVPAPGTALVSRTGRVIGLVTEARGSTIPFPAGPAIQIVHGEALAGSTVRDRARQLVETGHCVAGTLGATLSDVAWIRWLGLPALAVETVRDRGPAARAGLRRGDVIVTLDGWPVRDRDDLERRLADTGAGRHVTLGVLRAGEARAIEVELVADDAERAPEAARGLGRGRL